MDRDAFDEQRAMSTIAAGVERAEQLVLRKDYRGYDPYDALKASVFRLPGFRSSRLIRRGAQQVLRRSPVNVRPLLGIGEGRNPVTLGICLQAWALLGSLPTGQSDSRYKDRARRLVTELEGLRTPGWSGSCWGYDFDWETRSGTLQAGSPTVVATAFVTNGLFAAYELLGLPRTLDLCADACRFVTSDLIRTPGPDGSFCWSYSPLVSGCVLNATAKGSRLLAQVGSATGNRDLLADARRSLAFVARHQRADGSWPYAVRDDPRTWADSFHTAYVLDAFADYRARSGDESFGETTARGWGYYRLHFFEDGWLPRYYDNSLYPIDATAVAQSVITLCRFGAVETAVRIAAWAVDTMQRPDGGFIYRMHRHHRNTIQYMRWSTAWMLLALASVLAARARR